jgi:hypothetical protein
MQEVSGSIPLTSTTDSRNISLRTTGCGSPEVPIV